MRTVILYREDGTLVSVRHFDYPSHASDAYELTEVPSGQYLELRDRFGCLARKGPSA